VALGLALPGIAAERAILVLDRPGSTEAQTDSKAHITIAHETLSPVLSSMPDDLKLVLMT
jgi:Ca-activated chloride channel family protein